MSPRLAPESDEPNSAIACFSSSTSRALIDSVTWRVLASIGGDLGVDLLADGEAVRALLAAVARQIGLADEAGEAVAERHLDAAVADRGDRAGDDVALLDGAGGGRERIGRRAA